MKLLLKYIFFAIICVLLLPQIAMTQARMNISGDAFINISNGAYLVIDNGSSNALSTSGTGGNILSESETNRIRWNLNTNTGIYTIPWTSPSDVKIPLVMNITVAGSGANGYIDFSTWKTPTWDNNADRPSDVTNMAGTNANNSAYVIDRFWVINHESYTSSPSVNLTFGYDENERTPSGNTIPQGGMGAQRFNNVSDYWDNTSSKGTDNYPTQTITGLTADNSSFSQSWTLVDILNPLPIELIDFNATLINDHEANLTWQTAAEVNNDYFILERSANGIDWRELIRVKGAGNSSSINTYSEIDDNPYKGISYYRLINVDFDGEIFYSQIRTINLDDSENSQITIYPNPVINQITISGSKLERENIKIYNSIGQDVTIFIREKMNSERKTILDLSNLLSGMYYVKLNTTSYMVYKQSL